MSINQIKLYLAILLLTFGCNKKPSGDFSLLDENEKAETAESYHDISNYYLQPSELYRTYKDSALLVQPNNVNLRQRLSYSYKKVGEHIKAMEVLNKAVTIDTSNGNADALKYRAWTLLYYYRDYEGVIRDVELIEKITGNTYNSCWGEPCGFHKGQALYKLNSFNDAISAFNTVNLKEEELGFDINDNHLIFFYMGRCYAELKEYDKAITYYEKSLSSVKKFSTAYYQLGLLYKELNNNEKANYNFKLAKEYIDYGMNEPFIERFDEVFEYMIDNELKE